MTDLRFPWDMPPVAERPDRGEETRPPRRRGRRPEGEAKPDATDWQAGLLTVQGPAEDRAAFIGAAQGSGMTPWQEREAAWEEDAFHRALAIPAASRDLSIAGCRRLARHYREAVAAHRARANAWAQSAAGRQACPLDLHRLLPVPDAILARGAAAPEAIAWCRENWGLVQIRRIERRVEAAAVTYRFWASGGPGLQRERLARSWPRLLFR